MRECERWGPTSGDKLQVCGLRKGMCDFLRHTRTSTSQHRDNAKLTLFLSLCGLQSAFLRRKFIPIPSFLHRRTISIHPRLLLCIVILLISALLFVTCDTFVILLAGSLHSAYPRHRPNNLELPTLCSSSLPRRRRRPPSLGQGPDNDPFYPPHDVTSSASSPTGSREDREETCEIQQSIARCRSQYVRGDDSRATSGGGQDDYGRAPFGYFCWSYDEDLGTGWCTRM
jgi:hypothetical protein